MKLTARYKLEALLQFIGDFAIFYASLWGALFLRHLETPSQELFYSLLLPYSFIFMAWILVFFIEGLYEQHALSPTHEIAMSIVKAQVINGIIATLVFYFLPILSSAPKTILFLHILVSMFFIILWRVALHSTFQSQKRHPAFVFAKVPERVELEAALSKEKAKHPFKLALPFDETREYSDEMLADILEKNDVRFLILDTHDKALHEKFPTISNLMFSGLEVFDVRDIYEALFQRVPHSLLNYHWYLARVNKSSRFGYHFVKRAVDIFVSFLGIIISLPFYPFIALAIKLEDGGPVFIRQTRIGQNGKSFNAYKFRSMQRNEDGVWLLESDNKVTKVGEFLRKSRLDELPQLFAVLTGHMSLVGPRPDIAGLEKRLSENINHYKIRTLAKPGISGWALIKQNFVPQSVEETKQRLSYDLYYIKNRSLALDAKILLQTIKILLKRLGNARKKR